MSTPVIHHCKRGLLLLALSAACAGAYAAPVSPAKQALVDQVQAAVTAAQGVLDSAERFTESVEKSKSAIRTIVIVLVAGAVVAGVAGVVLSQRRR